MPEFDLLCGGFPCQAFSLAGKRQGFKDIRGTMFFEIARIAQEKKPRFLLLENVKGLLSHDKGKTMLTIFRVLDELGYDCQWQVLNSKNFGVPQHRERVFIIGHIRGACRPEIFPYQGEVQPGLQDLKQADSSLALSHIVPATGSYVASKPRNREPFVKIADGTKLGYTKAMIGDAINLSFPNSKTRRGRVGKQIAHTLDTSMLQYTLERENIRRLTPLECERLQGFPDNWTAGISDTQRYKCLGNAVTVNVVQGICEQLLASVAH